MKKTLFLASLAAFAVGFSAHAQVTTIVIDGNNLNGGFENPQVGAGDSKNGFDTAGKDILNWTNTPTNFAGGAATYTDNGVDFNAAGAHAGTQFAFFHGGEGGAFNLSAFTVQANDQITLSWFGRADTILFGLFTSTSGSLTGATFLANTGNVAQTPAAYGANTFNYTVQNTDALGPLGVVIYNPLAAGYANVDDVALTVTRAVPEPGTYALMFAGLGGLFFMLRARRASV